MSKHVKSKTTRPAEPQTVRTTIVGGRPPGSGKGVGDVPRGVEVLIKKAAVDPAFKKLLLEKRAGAAEAIGLKLTAAEEAMLAAVPLPQLEGIITHTRISPKLRPAFLGYAAGAMLAALSAAVTACDNHSNSSSGNRQNPPPETPRATAEKPAYPVRPAGEESPPGRSGKVNLAGALSNGTDMDAVAPRIASLGARADLPARAKGSPLSGRKKSGEVVRLLESTPTSITGSGAQDPKRSPTVISTVFRRHLSGISSAYRSARKRNPALGYGTIQIIITIDSKGLITSGNIASDDIGDEFLNSTILARIRGWRFPPIEEGDVAVTYPFTFLVGGD